MSHHTTTPSNMKTDWETLSIFAHLKNCYYSTVRKWIRQNEHRKWREFSVSLFSLRLYPSFPLPPLSFLPTSSPLSLSICYNATSTPVCLSSPLPEPTFLPLYPHASMSLHLLRSFPCLPSSPVRLFSKFFALSLPPVHWFLWFSCRIIVNWLQQRPLRKIAVFCFICR